MIAVGRSSARRSQPPLSAMPVEHLTPAIEDRAVEVPAPLQVTDLDLLALEFNPQLVRSKYIGEVRTGTGKSAAKPLDRIIWLRGLRELVGAESAEVTIAHVPSDRVWEVARSLSVVAQSVSDFERREHEAVGALADLGAHPANKPATIVGANIGSTFPRLAKDARAARSPGFRGGTALRLLPSQEELEDAGIEVEPAAWLDGVSRNQKGHYLQMGASGRAR